MQCSPRRLPPLLTVVASSTLHAQAASPDLSDLEVAHLAVTANSIGIKTAHPCMMMCVIEKPASKTSTSARRGEFRKAR